MEAMVGKKHVELTTDDSGVPRTFFQNVRKEDDREMARTVTADAGHWENQDSDADPDQ